MEEEQPPSPSTQAQPPILVEVGGEHTAVERQRYADEVAPQRDEVLLTHGSGDLRLYERLLRDDQVHSTFQQRRAAVVAMPLRVDAGGDAPIDHEAAEDLRRQLEAMPFDRITYKMLAGLMFGYAIGECMFRPEGTRVVLDTIRVRKARRFRFTVGGGLRMVSPRLERMPERKFWCFTCGANDDDDVHGQGLGHWLYWPVWFKRNAHRFWALWLEKFAQGVPVAKGPTGMSKADEENLLAVCRAVTAGGHVVIPKGVELALLEAARNSGGDYDVFMSRADAAISKIILSQTMTTDDGASLSQAQVHERTKGEVTRSDSGLLTESFGRGPARWLTEWNHPGAATPVVYRAFDDARDLGGAADVDGKLFVMGYRPSPARVAEVYGDDYELVGGSAEPAAPAQPEAAPSALPSSPEAVAITPGSEWIDTEDGHRMRVTAIDGNRVLFIDLDGANPDRQAGWSRAYFVERCRPTEAAKP